MVNRRSNTEDLPLFARLLRDARATFEITGAQVAEIINVSESTYRNAENGRYGASVVARIDRIFPEHAEEIQAAFKAHTGESTVPRQFESLPEPNPLTDIATALAQGLIAAGITRFHPSRKYYAVLREGRSTISQYISQAHESVEMVSITLATGMELERVIDAFEEMLSRRPSVAIRISLLDPTNDALMQVIAAALLASPSGLSAHIQDTIAALDKFRKERLAKRTRAHFEVWCHGCLPNFSAIILDGDSEHGLIQLETKGYRMGSEDSFGLEAAAPSEFFQKLRSSYRELMDDGKQIL